MNTTPMELQPAVEYSPAHLDLLQSRLQDKRNTELQQHLFDMTGIRFKCNYGTAKLGDWYFYLAKTTRAGRPVEVLNCGRLGRSGQGEEICTLQDLVNKLKSSDTNKGAN